MTTITCLPLHLVADILAMLDNVQLLPDVLISHRIFYNAYIDSPSLIIDMLRNKVPEPLLPLAVATYTSTAAFRDPRGIDALAFMNDYYDDPLRAFGGRLHLTLDSALYVSRLDDALVRLRKGFCEDALRRLHDERSSRDFPTAAEGEGEEGRGGRASPGEEYRVSRALYRFHIFGNLFLGREEEAEEEEEYGDDDDEEDKLEAQKAVFFKRHSPWVNEQLACVFDFLETRLTGVMLSLLSSTPACRDVVVNGLHWGGNLTEWLTSRSQAFEEQRCLSLGLVELDKLLGASTCEAWQSSLALAQSLRESTLEADLFAFNRHQKPPNADGIWRVSEMDKFASAVDADEARREDVDDHPRRIWSKIHFDSAHERFRFGAQTFAPMRFIYGLRSVGYVMWDGGRMEGEASKATIARAFRGEPV